MLVSDLCEALATSGRADTTDPSDPPEFLIPLGDQRNEAAEQSVYEWHHARADDT